CFSSSFGMTGFICLKGSSSDQNPHDFLRRSIVLRTCLILLFIVSQSSTTPFVQVYEDEGENRHRKIETAIEDIHRQMVMFAVTVKNRYQKISELFGAFLFLLPAIVAELF